MNLMSRVKDIRRSKYLALILIRWVAQIKCRGTTNNNFDDQWLNTNNKKGMKNAALVAVESFKSRKNPG